MTDNPTNDEADEAGLDAALGQHCASRREMLKTMGVAALLVERPSEPPTFAESSGAMRTWPTRSNRRRVPQTLQTRFTDTERPRFGTAVALDGETAVVGDPPGMTVESNTGIVAVCTREDGSWIRQSTVTPGERASGGDFGASVAVEGTTVLVGAPLPSVPDGPHGGVATVFERRGNTWRRRTELTSDGPSGVDRFGASVALDDDVAIVGAPADPDGEGAGTGSASIFTRAAGTWTLETTLIGADGIDEFGRAVTLDGEVAVVGARRTDGGGSTDNGVAFVYERSGGRWSRQAELVPGDGSRDDGFGAELVTDQQTVLVGAPTETNAMGPNVGAAYAFARSGATWVRQGRLVGEERPTNRFGTAVALNDRVAVIADRSGTAPLVFTKSKGRWEQHEMLTGERSKIRRAAVDVALNGEWAIVGVERDAARPGRSDGIVEVFKP